MKTNKLRFIVFLLMFSLVAVACGGDTADDAAEAPETTEAPQETLAAPATTAPPPEVIVVWAEEKVAVDGFEYKSFTEISKEFQNCKDVFAKLDYAKQLKKDAYDYVLDLDLDKLIIRLQNQIIINH